MRIKCPNCGTEYEPDWNDSNDCPICNYGLWVHIKTDTNTKEKLTK